MPYKAVHLSIFTPEIQAHFCVIKVNMGGLHPAMDPKKLGL